MIYIPHKISHSTKQSGSIVYMYNWFSDSLTKIKGHRQYIQCKHSRSTIQIHDCTKVWIVAIFWLNLPSAAGMPLLETDNKVENCCFKFSSRLLLSKKQLRFLHHKIIIYTISKNKMNSRDNLFGYNIFKHWLYSLVTGWC